jgi:hypothetical protein
VKSELIRNWLGLGIFAKIYNALIPITTEKGALTQLYLATSPEIEENNIKGEYYVRHTIRVKSLSYIKYLWCVGPLRKTFKSLS